ncbi:MAG: DUF2961 domain-containing protein, partial [Candidatus Aminicenantes bacterium]|nr:DUF2961 domain-containing protein [Candidatus Aminicenantes bacterium]
MRFKKSFVFLTVLIFCGAASIFSQDQPQSYSVLDNLAALKNYQSKRISSFDRSGKNADRLVIDSGETAVIAKIEGAGIIKHIWITISCKDPMIRRNALLRMYWDGEDHPSVESPIGDFFGQGWGEKYSLISLPLAVAPKEGNA